jgi:hypothetical protein
MEQYQMPLELDFENLRTCIDNYTADWLYIRLIGSKGGKVKVNEALESRTLDFAKDSSGLSFLIDSQEAFHFPLKEYNTERCKGFSLAYERFNVVNGIEQMVILGTGIDPYDPKLPEPRRSILRNVLDYHLLEIYFLGRIPLVFHSWWIEPDWKYWTVAK